MKPIDKLRNWLDSWKTKPPAVPDAPLPDVLRPLPPKKVSALSILWQLWRKKIDINSLVPLLALAPALLFLAVSGLLAWVAVLISFFWRFVQLVLQ